MTYFTVWNKNLLKIDLRAIKYKLNWWAFRFFHISVAILAYTTMSKSLTSKMVWLGVFLLNCISTTGCSAQSQNQQKKIVEYPAKFSLIQTTDAPHPKFGLHVIGKLNDFRDDFCWVGCKNNISKEQNNQDLRTSILQRVILKSRNLSQFQNYELPPYDRRALGTVLYPQFRGSSDSCFVRSIVGKDGIASYQLYALDLTSNLGELRERELFLFHPLKVSPNGTAYAFEWTQPYSNSDYHLFANINGETKIVSQSRYTQDFSWTSENKLIYADKKSSTQNEFGYPDIFEDDLQGNIKLIKKSGSHPLLSPDGKYLASFIPYTDSKTGNVNLDNVSYDFYRAKRAALSVYDTDKSRENIVTRIYEEYPDLFWSSDGTRLYVVENLYVFSKKTAICRISSYNTETQKYELLCKLEQRGEASSSEDSNFIPRFIPIDIANNKYLICQVPVEASGVDNFHVISVDLKTGARNDIFSFTATPSPYRLPMVDWIDRDTSKASLNQIDPKSKDKYSNNGIVFVVTEPPNLIFKGSIKDKSPFDSSKGQAVLPVRCLVYGNISRPISSKQKFCPELVKIDFTAVTPVVTKYQFLSETVNDDGYIFDPIITSTGRDIVFKFGRADMVTDIYGLYSFNIESKSVRKLSNKLLSWREVGVSPSGRFVSYIVSANPLELWVSDLKTGNNRRVAQGSSLASASRWIPNDELAYSLIKSHISQGTKVLQPDIFVYNPVSKAYRRLLNRGEIIQISDNGKYLLYSGLKNQKNSYGPRNTILRFADLTNHNSSAIGGTPRPSADLYSTFWNADANAFFFIRSELDSSYQGKNEKSTGAPMNRTLHRIYRYNIADRSLAEVASLTTTTPWEGTDLSFFSVTPTKKEFLFCVKSVSLQVSPYTTFSQRKYSLKSLNIETKQWKDMAEAEGIMGISGLQPDRKQVGLVRY